MRDAVESSSSERRPPAVKQQVLKRRRSVRAGAAGGRHGHHEAVSPSAMLMVLAEHQAEMRLQQSEHTAAASLASPGAVRAPTARHSSTKVTPLFIACKIDGQQALQAQERDGGGGRRKALPPLYAPAILQKRHKQIKPDKEFGSVSNEMSGEFVIEQSGSKRSRDCG